MARISRAALDKLEQMIEFVRGVTIVVMFRHELTDEIKSQYRESNDVLVVLDWK